MGLFRLLTFILVAWIVWRMIKNYQVKLGRRTTKAEKEKIPVRQKIVKCEFCSIHIPQEEAIAGNDSNYWFCTPEHKSSFNQQDS
ncbi:MAG: hypothetical protein COA71_03505 [SAR86 cluster bacterium]|uniref:TRASH domain-containing protein n=1 Tax=SAR86 cluster bacterium TaxID=2030880 RepID=A0A2A5CGG4_9GAMM|nr:hypothetical protein [Gammaproteobacteria bacterium AH-315-E17]PCJ42591.1 MAG: hypothetical protein COA71_03505 [SAR86 cluster bacterium]